MSSTRHSTDKSQFHQARYASDPEFSEIRGIEGAAVLLKAKTVSVAESHLLFFLQSRSLEEGGMDGLVADILELVPEHFGTRTMRHLHPGADGCFSDEASESIEAEICESSVITESSSGGASNVTWREEEPKPDSPIEFIGTVLPKRVETVWEDMDGNLHTDWLDEVRPKPANAGRRSPRRTASEFRKACEAKAKEELPRLIAEVCIRPRLEVLPPGFPGASRRRPGTEICEVPYLRNLGWTLSVYRQRYVERAKRRFAETSISKALHPELEYALETRRMVLIEGDSGVGKTESAKAWCDQHRHVSRYLTLSGIGNRTTLAKAVAQALGLPKSSGLSATKILPRIEDFLRRSAVMLVIDEAHYALPQNNRPNRPPELINWLMTACCNHGVPVALIATSEWRRRLVNTEKHTRWNAEQLSRRIVRFKALPPKPTEEDLFAVARSVAPEATQTALLGLVAYALRCDGSLTRLVDVIADARRLAEAAGRTEILKGDVVAASDFRSASDDALMSIHSIRSKGPMPGPQTEEPFVGSRRRRAGVLQDPCDAPAGRAIEPGSETISLPVGRLNPRRREQSESALGSAVVSDSR